MPVQSATTLKGYFVTGRVPIEPNYVDLIDSMFGGVGGDFVREGPGIDIVTDGLDKYIGVGLDSILLSHSNGDPAGEYPFSSQGLTDSLSASIDGDLIWLPSGEFTLDITIPEGVKVFSLGNCKINGTVTLSDRSIIEKITVSPSGNENSLYIVGITGTGTGIANVYSCDVIPVNAGSGGVIAVRANGSYILKIHESFLDGRNNVGGGTGYAAFRSSDSGIYIEGGTCLGSDPDTPFNE